MRTEISHNKGEARMEWGGTTHFQVDIEMCSGWHILGHAEVIGAMGQQILIFEKHIQNGPRPVVRNESQNWSPMTHFRKRVKICRGRLIGWNEIRRKVGRGWLNLKKARQNVQWPAHVSIHRNMLQNGSVTTHFEKYIKICRDPLECHRMSRKICRYRPILKTLPNGPCVTISVHTKWVTDNAFSKT